MAQTLKQIKGGVTAPVGFLAGGMACGIKRSGKPDLAVIYSQQPTVAAGVFTQNKVVAAPVVWSRSVATARDVRVIIANSGNANACTGGQGTIDAQEMAAVAAESLELNPQQVFVCSTGRIGRLLPMEKLRAAIPEVVRKATASGSSAAARALLTSDTKPKDFAVELTLNRKPVRVGGIAKGAGMIEPTLATMLAFITTDAAISATLWRKLLQDVVATTFNCITVDGDMSTNDTVLALANGASGAARINDQKSREYTKLHAAVSSVCAVLARKIVDDGECASRFVDVVVNGAASDDEALLAARAVANSLLVKCAWSGGDPNWGRVMCAVGYSGADILPERIDIKYDDVAAVRGGLAVPDSERALRKVVARKRFRVTIDLNIGAGEGEVWTTDVTPEYVVYNQSE